MTLLKYIGIAAVLGVILLFGSCKKYLEEKSDKSLVVPGTAEDLLALLDDNEIMNKRTPGFGEHAADDYFVRPEVYDGLGDISQRAYIWQLENYSYSNDWKFAYNAIYNANFCLDKIDGIEVTTQNEANHKLAKGGAYYFRGFYFLHLLWDYAKAYDASTADADYGIALRLQSDFNVPSVRATNEESYKQAIDDLKKSAALLPALPQHVMRPSKAAAYGELARAYLSMRMYDSSYYFADEALKIKSDLLDYNGPEAPPTSGLLFAPFNREIIFYCTQSENYDGKNFPKGLIDTMLYAQFDENDIRKTAFFFGSNGYYAFKGSYSSAPNPCFTGITTAELYLIRAECHARAGRVSEALSNLNTLLVARWKTGTFSAVASDDAAEVLSIVLLERRKELIRRGVRWMDVKRLNKEGANISITRKTNAGEFTLPANDSRYALPLPSDVIKLTGMPQNPGWQ